MEISRKSIEPFHARVSFGLNRHYSDELLLKEDVIKAIQAYQAKLISERDIYLSVSISDALIVLRNQKEPHLILNFINYPRFPLNHSELKQEIENLVKHLMAMFSQNRVVIEFHDETVMFERSKDIDPRIIANTQI